jgi:hypothetical protein
VPRALPAWRSLGGWSISEPWRFLTFASVGKTPSHWIVLPSATSLAFVALKLAALKVAVSRVLSIWPQGAFGARIDVQSKTLCLHQRLGGGVQVGIAIPGLDQTEVNHRADRASWSVCRDRGYSLSNGIVTESHLLRAGIGGSARRHR